jgi:hypothetical protein
MSELWYHSVRDQIQHEDSLIMQRLAWLTAAQSFLFTAYAITANASPQPNNPVSVKQQDLLFIIIPAVACLCDVLIYCSVIAGILVQNRLRDAYATHVASVDGFPGDPRKPLHVLVGPGCAGSSAAGLFDRLAYHLEPDA